MFDYLPLHNAMSGFHEYLSPLHRVYYFIAGTFTLGGYGILAVLALWGVKSTVAEEGDWAV